MVSKGGLSARFKAVTGIEIAISNVSLTLGTAAGSPPGAILEWTELPPLPPPPGQEAHRGVGASYSGVHQDALIVAGGTKVLNAPPWPSAEKVWCDDIFVSERTGDGQYKWYSDEPTPSCKPLYVL